MPGDCKHIILVDDHIVIRNGLKTLIEKIGPYRVMAEFDNGSDLIGALPDLSPDLIVMDLSMPVMGGDETIVRMNELGLTYPILILTLNYNQEQIVRLFRLGVRGYLEKSCTAATLKRALEDLFATGYYHNEQMYLALHSESETKKPDERSVGLSKREQEFLQLVCHEDEYTYDQIAAKMGVAMRTVDGYRESIFEKFNIKSKTGLVLFALKNNLFGGR